MSGDIVATVIAREATRRRQTEPLAEPGTTQRGAAGGRGAAARALQGLAHRLDPQLAAPHPQR